jgi:predicted aspartyl protease
VIPFELVHDVPIVRATMNGAGPYNFILDTGADPSAVDLATARLARIFLDESRSGEAQGAGANRVPIFAARIDVLALGEYRADSIDAVAVDLSAIAGRLGIPLHGVLGHSLLAGRVVRIDYPHGTITFLPPSYRVSRTKPVPSGSRVTVPLEFPPHESIPLVSTFHVNGRTLPVTLDTGSGLTLELAPADAIALGVRGSQLPADTGAALGARGAVTLRPAEADDLGIGSMHLQNVTVQISPRLQDAPYRHGNLGNGFLKHFVLTLDYSHGELTLESPGSKQ